MNANPRQAAVVGMGEVGRRLAAALAAAGTEVTPVRRDAGWDRLGDGPVLVCVREEALPELLGRLHAVPASRLVFVQNGWVGELLAGFPGSNRGLIWFTSKGDFFRVLRPSVFCGPLATALAEALGRGGIPAAAVEAPLFAAAEAEKMAFNCVVGLPLAVHGVSLGEYLTQHAPEAEAVFGEAATVTARALGVAASPGWWPAFLESAQPLAFVRAAAPKAMEFRNGAVARLARRLGDPARINERLLVAAGSPV